jgi:hypothetical protein
MTRVTFVQRFKNMGKWLILFFDTLVYICSFVQTNTNTNTPLGSEFSPCSAYFMVDTMYDVQLMTNQQKEYVRRNVAAVGVGSMFALFGCGLGMLGQYGPEDVNPKLKLPGF